MYTYRASELGGCIKMLVAKRLGMKAHETPPAKMAKIFERGNRHETACLASMVEDKWEITSQQREVTLPITDKVRVVGHLDAVGYHPIDSPMHRIIEAKAPQAWRLFIDEMYSDDPSPMIERYKWQISCYMIGEDREAILTCLDETFQLRYHGIELPFYTLDDIKDRVGMLESLAADGYEGLPKFCVPREYPCQFFHLHEDEQTAFDIDTELDVAVERYDKYRIKAADAKDQMDKAKDRLLEVMGTRRRVQTNDSMVSLYNRKNTKYDYKRMQSDGIDINAYKVESESADIPRVSRKGKGDDDA